MVSRVLMLASLVCCGLVLLSFAMFAYDQTSGASKHQVSALNGTPSQTASGTVVSGESTAPAQDRSQPRRFIDGAARQLTGPFRSVLHGRSQWAIWLVSTLIALLIYGVGLGYLARAVRLRHAAA